MLSNKNGCLRCNIIYDYLPHMVPNILVMHLNEAFYVLGSDKKWILALYFNIMLLETIMDIDFYY